MDENSKISFVHCNREEGKEMQKLTLSYATTALGVVVIAVGLYMRFAINYHGKAYAVIVIGVLALIAGIILMMRSRPSTQK
jgi:uncharacterized membrane protein HdeD (DUF308 family)